MEIRENFQNFLNEFSGNLQRESDRKLSENKALTEYVQSPEGQRASTAVGMGVASLLPIPGMKRMFGTRMMNMMKPPAPPKREPFLPETSRKIKDYAERQKLADQKMMFQQKQIRNNIKNEPPLGTTTKNPMEEIAAKRILEQQTNRRNFLRQNVQKDQSLISANEAPSPEYFKNMAELKKLEDLLK